jgi:hypothetical protein
MSMTVIPWGTLVVEATTMFLLLLGLGLGLIGICSLWSERR